MQSLTTKVLILDPTISILMNAAEMESWKSTL